ncbi:glycosyl hydrolase family 18 protein [Streptomyces sp. NBC_01281]|uniref:glycosyl hydrolase family 18 protein n=1 Tax=unclassified Streptomyces TaxID=2593676 RepID=UPI0022565F81|nr:MULTISPECIES: glycosyl hydrolase family 18 protein [unclassified Streptomyces]MCX5131107.1 glycosyl hydrolase family 18 protein [Streptomyces sp. NBC_00340]WSK61379.1 glycosyl hydrolase family 18 protein [Streptomyces sp. NBC_01281]
MDTGRDSGPDEQRERGGATAPRQDPPDPAVPRQGPSDPTAGPAPRPPRSDAPALPGTEPADGTRSHEERPSLPGQDTGPRPGGASPYRRLVRVWRHPRLRTPRRIALGLVLLLLLPLLAAGIVLRVNYAGDPAAGTQTRNRDALWLGHAWVDGRKSDADLDALAERLRGTGIRDLYVHAGPLEHDGSLPATAYPSAGRLIAAVHERLPHVRVQAWLGDELATETPDGMRLQRAGTRDAVVRSAGRILDAGFDGVHFDLEPLHSGDAHYLALLDRLHALTRARHVQLSVASHQIDPLPGLHSAAGTLTGHPKWWSQAYFGQVARRVDQIAVMSYDTAMPIQSLYGGYVAQQTALALEVTPTSTDLLMGLPFFHENKMGHSAYAETVAAAVRGTRLGLSRTDRTREHFGVALYVDFAATETDWTAYREDWVGKE